METKHFQTSRTFFFALCFFCKHFDFDLKSCKTLSMAPLIQITCADHNQTKSLSQLLVIMEILAGEENIWSGWRTSVYEGHLCISDWSNSIRLCFDRFHDTFRQYMWTALAHCTRKWIELITLPSFRPFIYGCIGSWVFIIYTIAYINELNGIGRKCTHVWSWSNRCLTL